MCCKAPVLAYADCSKPFLVHTDASLDGPGAVLYQEQEGKERVIAYASRGLTPSERNYLVHKLEFLALKWAVTDKFHDHLYGNQFTVCTDNNPLMYVLTTAKLDAMGHHWVASLSCYNFDIVYRSGANKADADALSRITWPQKLQEVDSGSAVQALCHQVSTDYSTVESYGFDDEIVPDDLEASQLVRTIDWLKEQTADPAIATVVQCISDGQPWPPGSGCSSDLRSLLREKDRLRVRDGLLYRERSSGDQESPQQEFQLIIPPQCRKQIVELVHNKAGARAHPIIVATKVLLPQDDHWCCSPYLRLSKVSVSQTSYRPGRTTGEFPYNPAHGISLHRLSHLGVIQRRVWKHSCGYRPFYQVLPSISNQEPDC